MPVFTKNIELSEDFPTIRPTLNLNFTGARALDPRVTFARASIGTYVGSDGLIKTAGEDEARFDHDPDTLESLGLLIEESRTNLIAYSDGIGGGWSGNGVSLTTINSVNGPDGIAGVTEIRDNNSNSYHAGYYGTVSIDGTSNYTISSWLKKGPNYRSDIGSGGRFMLYCSNGSVTASIQINSDFDTIVAENNVISSSLTQYSNGWIRVSYTFTAAAATNVSPHFLLGNGGQYQGDATNSVYIWGAQIEQGAFPTSIIPTSGSAVTRQDDIGSIIGDDFTSFFNQSEGTFDVGYRLGEDNVSMRVCQISNGSASTIIDLVAGSGSGLGGYWFIKTGTNQFSQPTIDNSTQVDRNFRSVLAYKENDCVAQNNKTPAGPTTDTSVTLASNYNQLLFYQIANGEDLLQGHIKFIRYYPKRLTDAQVTLFSQD